MIVLQSTTQYDICLVCGNFAQIFDVVDTKDGTVLGSACEHCAEMPL